MKDLQLENLSDLMGLVSAENYRQIRKWGVQDHDPGWWMTILTEEVGELAEAILEFHFGKGPTNHVAHEAIQVATVALKIAEGFIAWPAERQDGEGRP